MRITLTMHESSRLSKNSGLEVVTGYRVDRTPGMETVFVSNFAAPTGVSWQFCIDGNIDDSQYPSATVALAKLQEHVDSNLH
jgi:hypothetical protein